MENIIFDDEKIIGYSWDIARYMQDEFDRTQDEDEKDLFSDCLKELEKHDGLVICYYDAMGAYFVYDLIEKENA